MSSHDAQRVHPGPNLDYLVQLAEVPRGPERLGPRRRATIDIWLSHLPRYIDHSSIPNGSVTVPSSDSPPQLFPRQGHTVSNITPNGDLYIFGGRTPPGTYLNDLWVYSTKDNTAKKLLCGGDHPSPRAYSSISVTDNGKLLTLWGGGSQTSQFDNALYFLNMDSHEWIRVECPDSAPPGRQQHAFVTVKSKLYIFGGYTSSNGSEWQYLNDIWSFDLYTLRGQPAWEPIQHTSEEQPKPRKGHQWVFDDNRLITFGGFGDRYYDELWSFDLTSLEWSKLECTHQAPPGRANYAITIADGMLYVYGGNHGNVLNDLAVLKISTQRWFMVEPIPPGPRNFHTMAAVGPSVYVLGGTSYDQQLDLEIIHVLETEFIKVFTEMEKLRDDSEQATNRQFAASIMVGEGDGDENVYSKFILKVVRQVGQDQETAMEESLELNINTEISTTSFYSSGAEEDPPKQSLHVTYQKADQLTGNAEYRGMIGDGKIRIETGRGLIVQGEIVGGPDTVQTFVGSGAWRKI